jgi:pSer/pThr/pTyr-binding forkhead associated (FHA) protein
MVKEVTPVAKGNATMITLSVEKNGQAHAVYTLCKDRIIMGRHADCDVMLDDPAVSRKHAIIECKQGRVVVADAFSKNGTVVNNRCISSCDLRGGDEIVIQPFRIHVDLG